MQHFKILTRGILLTNFIFLLACNDAARDTINPDISLNPPDVPQSVSASTDNGVVTLSWSEVVAYNENTIPAYNIYLNQTANVTKSDTKIEKIALPPYTVTGLNVGETYYFVVAAETRNGESNISAEVSAVAPNAVLVSITLIPADTTIVTGRTIQFKANGLYSNGASNDLTSLVTWEAEDTQLTIVDNEGVKGLATAKLIGKTNITATDPISKISGKTTLQAQFDHGTDSSVYSCFFCHNKPEDHLNTTSACANCHVSFDPLPLEIGPFKWKPFVEMDHREVVNSCFTCHDGIKYEGKSSSHINSTEMCDSCHTTDATNSWVVPVVDHSQVIGDCFECHDGTIALGKDADHTNTTNVCDACHTNFNAFRPVANMDHNEAIGTCNACHDGVIAKGKGSRHFVYSALACSACHNTARWPISRTYPHDIAGTEYPRPDHLFGNVNCRRCHTQGTSTIFAGLTSCARCHQDNYDPAKHINAAVSNLRDCSGACHKPGPEHRAGDSGWLVVVPLFIE